MKAIIFVILFVVLFASGSTPQFQARLIPEPLQTPKARPTPFPTPRVDLEAYIPRKTYNATATVSLERVSLRLEKQAERQGEKFQRISSQLATSQQEAKAKNDLGLLLRAVNDQLANFSGYSQVLVQGGGSIKTPPVLKHDHKFDSSTYSCDQTDATGVIQGISVTDYGCFLVGDNVYVEGTWRRPQVLVDYFTRGKGYDHTDPYLRAVQGLTPEQLAGKGTTILEPTFSNQWPASEVFQALGDACCSHTEKSEKIVIRGFRIVGRQGKYDGGVRSTMLFGNCYGCAAFDNYLEDTASIGISMGGSGQKGYFANNVAIARNVFSGVGAANSATINTENGYVFENYVRRPGHHNPSFGGGVCGHDHETNTEFDHTRNIFVYNSLYDYEGGHLQWGTGNAICLQDPHLSKQFRGLVVAANNVIIGGREDLLYRYLSNGIFLVGLIDYKIINNYVFRTGQNAIQAYDVHNGLIQDNDFEMTGGGGNSTIQLNNSSGNKIIKNFFRFRPGLSVSVDSQFVDTCGRENLFQSTNAEIIKKPCAAAPRP